MNRAGEARTGKRTGVGTGAGARESAVVAAMAAAAALIVAVLTSCATEQVTEFSHTQIVGAVYDEEGTPIPAATVVLGRLRATTDHFGRFVVTGVSPGPVHAEATADGHEAWSGTVHIGAQTQYLRIRLQSVTGLIDRAIACAGDGDRDRLSELLVRIRAIAPEDPRTAALTRFTSATAERGVAP